MDRAGFDPRYNPEFQRGFDPAVHNGPATSPQTHERIPAIPEPVAQRVPPPPAQGDLVPPPPLPDGDAEEFAEPAEEVRVSPWRNPWVIVLTIVGLILLAAGVGAFRWSVEQVYMGQYGFASEDSEAREAWLSAQVAWGLSPLLALAGVLTLLGVIFFVAVTWRPHRARTDDEYGDFDDIDVVR